MPIVNRVADLLLEISAWRQDIHTHPELMFDVHRTAGIVAEKLKSFGCDDVVTGIGRTGVVGVIRGKRGGGNRTSPNRWPGAVFSRWGDSSVSPVKGGRLGLRPCVAGRRPRGGT